MPLSGSNLSSRNKKNGTNKAKSKKNTVIVSEHSLRLPIKRRHQWLNQALHHLCASLGPPTGIGYVLKVGIADFMRILVFIDHYMPGYKAGGPLRSIANLVEILGDEIDFDIVTRDRDLNDNRPYHDVVIDDWQRVGKARVLYMSPKLTTLNRLYRLLKAERYDWVYLNSFFSPFSAVAPLIALAGFRAFEGNNVPKVLIAPRGEFSPNALKIKPSKKRLYLAVGQLAGLWGRARFQASVPHEASDIQNTLKVSTEYIHIASDLTAALHRPDQINGGKGLRLEGVPLRLVYLSRISPMKNLLFALEALRHVTAQVHFSIYGPIDDEIYWRTCQSAINQLPGHICVTYCGPISHETVSGTLARHDLFYLPSRGENFGHVLVEALQAGLPLLISDQTPWRGLKDRNIGLDLALDDPLEFSAYIDEFATASEADLEAMQTAIESEVARMTDQSEAIAANRGLFSS
jgi:glycosyltransferase involved in cell wall biosynthesis